uniref:Uncharacterized protein n=2 Tax=Lactuca sativa TaxID=4236 RepID=A0A9R1VEF6_LACSA|nr:hypothetical protein LSAT_V11C500281270 [Lactuca sativa]KAJ0205467.1 hypothetical protein LSAT_V11C500281150 [Lactuca sativa]
MDHGKAIVDGGVSVEGTSGLLPHEKLKAESELSDSEGNLEPTTPLSLSERDEEDEDVESEVEPEEDCNSPEPQGKRESYWNLEELARQEEEEIGQRNIKEDQVLRFGEHRRNVLRLGEWSRGGPAILPGVTRRVEEGTRRADKESQKVERRLDSPSRHGTRREGCSSLVCARVISGVASFSIYEAFMYGPEGVDMRTGRSGPGKAYVCKCILGNSLSIYAYSCRACISDPEEEPEEDPEEEPEEDPEEESEGNHVEYHAEQRYETFHMPYVEYTPTSPGTYWERLYKDEMPQAQLEIHSLKRKIEEIDEHRSRLVQENQIRVDAAMKSKRKIQRLEQEVSELRKLTITKLWEGFVAWAKQAKATTYGLLDKVVGREPPQAEVLVIQSGPGDRKAKKIRKYLKEGKRILKYDDIVFKN